MVLQMLELLQDTETIVLANDAEPETGLCALHYAVLHSQSSAVRYLSVQSSPETDTRCAASCLIERLADPNLMQAAGSLSCNSRGVSLPAGAVTPLRLAVAEVPTAGQLHTRIQILQTLLCASNGFSRSSGPDGLTAIQASSCGP